jgi:ParB family chromosome partitioning protein
MVESIKANGILVPIIVRPAKSEKDKFEILSGHNRVNAAEINELTEVPAIIREGLEEEAARFIVTETNLIQRSFADLSHCERAVVLETHYSELKQSKRKDGLIKEVEEILSPLGTKTKSVRDISGEYGLSKNTVARYLRVEKLIDELKIRLDEKKPGGKLTVRTAVSLSYLRDNEQRMVNELLERGRFRIDMKTAEALRKKSEELELTSEDIELLLSDSSKEERQRAVKINESIYSQYFKEEISNDEISVIVEKALQMWFENNVSTDA